MRLYITNDLQSQMIKLSSRYIDLSISRLSPSTSVSKVASKEIQLESNYEAPKFAQSIYPYLLDLHNIFSDLPAMGKALANAQKMLYNVNRCEAVDTNVISEFYALQIAIKGLRISLTNAGHLPINKMREPSLNQAKLSDLPVEDKSHALLVEALRRQTKKFETIVAVVDASGLAGLRKHWNTHVPLELEVKEMVGKLVTDCEGEGEMSNDTDRKRLLTDKPLVAVGAGATAVLGASSLSKAATLKFPASTLMKVVTFKVPASLKLFLRQTHKTVEFALSKTLGPSKMVAPGVKSTTLLKTTASAEKIRVAAHSVIGAAEKTSFSAMRTAFYQIMRKRHIRKIGVLPWATFGCSIATCAGLVAYGDGIECAAESLPAAPSFASLGPGIQSLHLASQEISLRDSMKLQKSIESLMYRLKKVRTQYRCSSCTSKGGGCVNVGIPSQEKNSNSGVCEAKRLDLVRILIRSRKGG